MIQAQAELKTGFAAELAAEQRTTTLEFSVTLKGDLAKTFNAFHQDLGGNTVQSRGDLTAELLRRVLCPEPLALPEHRTALVQIFKRMPAFRRISDT
jgi:hypothetical protein